MKRIMWNMRWGIIILEKMKWNIIILKIIMKKIKNKIYNIIY